MSPQPIRLAFLTVDLEGSTPILRALGSEYPDLLRRFRRAIDDACAEHGGTIEFSEGDGVLAVFTSPVDALDAGVSIAQRLADATWPPSVDVRPRMAVHVGSAVRTDEGLVGLDVHRAARIGGAASGSQLLLSDDARAAIVGVAAERGWAVEDLGWFVLAGLEAPERLASLDAPPLTGKCRTPRARRRFTTSIPVPAHPIVGRTAELDDVRRLVMRSDVRLVTVGGPGGTGKTRLAIEVARGLESEFRDGVVFVDLSAVTTPDRMLVTMGRVFGIREAETRTMLDAFASVVGDAAMLLVLDNLEQIDGAGSAVGSLLERLDNVRILATSREPLRTRWEHEYPLGPLGGTGSDVTEGAEDPAVRLFIDRARLVHPSFTVDDRALHTISSIVRRLDGLPLAIELAAARLRAMDVDTLLLQLEHRLDVLDHGPLDAPERHRTMTLAIEWSHDLLSEEERTIFRRFGVFADGAPIGVVPAVCGDDVLAPRRVAEIMDGLVSRSLIVFGISDDGSPRYRMLETIREFALARLGASGEEHDVRRRHLLWVASVADEMAGALATPHFLQVLDALDRERFNIRQALRWSIASGSDLEVAMTMFGTAPLFWDIRGYVQEAIDWATQLLDATADRGTTRGRALVLDTLGWSALLAGDVECSERSHQASEAMWRELGDGEGLAWSLAMHGMTTYNLGDLTRSRAYFEEATDIARSRGMTWLADAWCVFGLGHVAMSEGRLSEARDLLVSVLEYSTEHGLLWGIGHAQFGLGVLSFMEGDTDEATTRIVESGAIRRDLKDLRGIADCLGLLALIASATGDHERAATLLGAGDVVRDGAGQRTAPWQEPLLAQARSDSLGALGPGFAAAYRRGRDLSGDAGLDLVPGRPRMAAGRSAE